MDSDAALGVEHLPFHWFLDAASYVRLVEYSNSASTAPIPFYHPDMTSEQRNHVEKVMRKENQEWLDSIRGEDEALANSRYPPGFWLSVYRDPNDSHDQRHYMPLPNDPVHEYPLDAKYHKMTVARTMISLVARLSILRDVAPFKFSVFRFKACALHHHVNSDSPNWNVSLSMCYRVNEFCHVYLKDCTCLDGGMEPRITGPHPVHQRNHTDWVPPNTDGAARDDEETLWTIERLQGRFKLFTLHVLLDYRGRRLMLASPADSFTTLCRQMCVMRMTVYHGGITHRSEENKNCPSMHVHFDQQI